MTGRKLGVKNCFTKNLMVSLDCFSRKLFCKQEHSFEVLNIVMSKEPCIILRNSK